MTGSWVTTDLQSGTLRSLREDQGLKAKRRFIMDVGMSGNAYVKKTGVRYFGGVHRGQCDGVVTRS